MRVRAFAPGRVNLIGDHTDYTGGFALPMAVHLGTTVEVERGGRRVELRSTNEAETVDVPLDVEDYAGQDWGRYVAAVVAEVRPLEGARGIVSTSLPIGAGLSSSAALEVAVALALGFRGTPLELAKACQRAEQRAWGVRTGIMDQLASAAGQPGHGLLIDFDSLDIALVPIPGSLQVVVVDSGQRRSLATSAYEDRRRQCEAAAAIVGPLRAAAVEDLKVLGDATLRRRARHVVTENARVLAFAESLATGDLHEAGRLMVESHMSLRDDFEVSTPVLDETVQQLLGVDGVHGARLTGAGFGGCVVVLADSEVVLPGWRVRPVGGAVAEVL